MFEAGLEDDGGHEATHEHEHRGVAPGGGLAEILMTRPEAGDPSTRRYS